MIKINCDLCGKSDEGLLRTLIEGVELSVCTECSKFGKVIGPSMKYIPKKPKKTVIEEPKEEKIEILVENYSELIKKRRESLGLSQKDFAKRINEKESTVHHIETGHFEPSLAIARKLERTLGIKLIEEHEENHELPAKKKSEESFTLGDFIKTK